MEFRYVYKDEILEIDAPRHLVIVKDVAVMLTRFQFQILCLLTERSGSVVSLQEIGESIGSDADYVPWHMSRLRRNLGEAGERILTVRAYGYRYLPSISFQPD